MKNKLVSLFIRVLPLFAALLITGCATPPVTVNDSQLNWLQFKYIPVTKGAKPCRVNLIGAGYIEFTEGTSPLVKDDFSVAVDDRNWQDVNRERLGVPPDVIRMWLQRFSDAGVTLPPKRRKNPDPNAEPKDIAIFRANINMKKYACASDDDELLYAVRELIAIIKSEGN